MLMFLWDGSWEAIKRLLSTIVFLSSAPSEDIGENGAVPHKSKSVNVFFKALLPISIFHLGSGFMKICYKQFLNINLLF